MKNAVAFMLTGLVLTSVAALMCVWGSAASQAAAGGFGTWASAAAVLPWRTGRNEIALRTAMGLAGACSFAAAVTALCSQDPGPGRFAADVAMVAGANFGFPACFAIMLLAARRGTIRLG